MEIKNTYEKNNENYSAPSIKIFVYHTPEHNSVQLPSSHFFHMKGGAVFDDNNIQDGLTGDNTGDNISIKNKSYCELTIQYWAWKNIDVDYYGFCHYRHYFSFNTKKFPVDEKKHIIRPFLNSKTIAEFLLNDTGQIKNIIYEYDIIAPAPVDLKKINFSSVYEQYKYCPHLNIKDLDTILDIIYEKYPEYYYSAKKYLSGSKLFLYNIFIARKEIFFKYCQWLFDIISEFEKRSNMNLYSEEGFRTPKHLGEKLFGIYFTHLLKSSKIKNRELQLLKIKDTSKMETLLPAFTKESVNVVLSSNEYFAPYCAATIRSVLDHLNKDRCLDIIILEDNILPKTKKMLLAMISGLQNVSLRFINVKLIFSDYTLVTREHYSNVTYYRLALSDILLEYDKILYLDSDLIVLDDISELFDIDMSTYCFAGVIDIVLSGHNNGFSPNNHRPYYLNTVKIKEKNLLNMINAGVLVMNLSIIRKHYSSLELLEYAQAGKFMLCDQDVINSLFQDNILHLENEWNVIYNEEGALHKPIASFAPKGMYQAYKRALENPKILHFCGPIKPWNEPDFEAAYLFWDVLKRTPFYEIAILHRNSATQVAKKNIAGKIKPIFKKTISFFFPHKSRRRRILIILYKKLRNRNI
jgi:lipopolysaccharide biosynthesis glycosyltransferase